MAPRGHACWPRKETSAKPSAGPGSTDCPWTTTCRTSANSSTPRQGAVLLARYGTDGDSGSLNEVARLLKRLLSAGEAGGRTGSVIEILVMRALTHHAGGDTPGALAPLERAPTLAEPEGSVQVFVGEGPPTASLLTAVASRGPRVGLRSSTPGRLYPRRCDRPRGDPRRPGHPPQEWTRRAAERPRTRCAANDAHPHRDHLRQARSEQPTGSGPPGRGAGPPLAHPRPLTSEHCRRAARRPSMVTRLGHPSGDHRTSRTGRAANPRLHRIPPSRRPFPGLPHHIPIGRVTTSITTSGDVGSPHRLLPFRSHHQNGREIHPGR